MRALILAAALALAGCASTYQLTVMPRDSGKLYSGVAQDAGKGEGRISITLEDKTYSGTWVETQPSEATGYVTGGLWWGSGWGGRGALGTLITLDKPPGGGAEGLPPPRGGTGRRLAVQNGPGRAGGGVTHAHGSA